MDLKKPLKKGTMVKFKEKNLRVHFKYERLPTFYFVCGRVGHQLKDCETLEDPNEEGFKKIKEQEISFGQWLRASPLPKIVEDHKKMETSSENCSKNLFNASSRQSRFESKGNERAEEPEVQQQKQSEGSKEVSRGSKLAEKGGTLDIEKVAESFGAVALTTEMVGRNTGVARKKWTRKRGNQKKVGPANKGGERGLKGAKIQLIDVMVIEGSIDDCRNGEKKRKQSMAEEDTNKLGPVVVLDTQHRLQQ
ncbi:unnamed protein product [Vicia faba]|uniref:Zinc knuckle CX2CX4HX4C domain-containing protein n=1 Tax=Vicia faba TaxID=3906 RepID=A0AAV0YG48_VICFA|nr:unnamed protein product [Vicia faba]